MVDFKAAVQAAKDRTAKRMRDQGLDPNNHLDYIAYSRMVCERLKAELSAGSDALRG